MLEAVPNVSEGRDARIVASIGTAFAEHAELLDVHSDPDHNRSVFTLADEPERLVESLVAGTARALELVDLAAHEGVHPRVGVVDVAPLVPIRDDGMQAAKRAALALGERVGNELGVPVFLYGEVGGGRRPAFYRRGGIPELTRRVDAGELVPAFGPLGIDPKAGAVLVGARSVLVAYNVQLATDDVETARTIAAAVRESSGGLPGVQAIGLRLPRAGSVQVSMNVVDLERAPLHAVVARVEAEARARGIDVAGAELVGLVPARALEAANLAGVSLPGVDESRVLERLVDAHDRL